MKYILIALMALCATGSAKAGETLSLEQAIAKAIENSPRLASKQAEAGIAKGELMQAGALQNPEIVLEAENIAGNSSYRGFDRAEVTYGVRQTLELGGKRSARTKASQYSLNAANTDAESTRLDIIHDVSATYMQAVAADEKLVLAKEQHDLAKELLSNVTKRVKAAASPLIQQSKAQVSVGSSTIAVKHAEKEKIAQYAMLESLTGTNILILDKKRFLTLPALPKKKNIQEVLQNNPNIIKASHLQESNKAMVTLADAGAIPDPSLNVGIRDFRDEGDQAFVVGVSFPIPVFNQNQGNKIKARQELSRIESDKRQAELVLTQRYVETHANLASAYENASTLKQEIIPQAQKAFSQSKQGYEAGKFQYLEVLDSERTLFEAKAQYIDALLSYHLQYAELSRLTGENFNKENQNAKK